MSCIACKLTNVSFPYSVVWLMDNIRCSWGQPFLEHTYLYHLTRRDHRHNFSLYFYPTYLAHSLSRTTILRNPLLSFVPQMVLSLGTGFIFGTHDLPFAWFVQTSVFVLFNKVCTSQVCTESVSCGLSLMRSYCCSSTLCGTCGSSH